MKPLENLELPTCVMPRGPFVAPYNADGSNLRPSCVRHIIYEYNKMKHPLGFVLTLLPREAIFIISATGVDRVAGVSVS